LIKGRTNLSDLKMNLGENNETYSLYMKQKAAITEARERF